MPEITPPFPQPERIAGRNYWTKGAIRRWRAANSGRPQPDPASDDDVLMSARQVRALFGDVSDMWLWRRRRESKAAETTGQTAA